MSASTPEPASPWQQTDLLMLLSESAGQGAVVAPPPIVPVPPADPGASEGQVPTETRKLTECPQPERDPDPPEARAPGSAPATLVILDTETTGLDPTHGQCIEVGAILFAVREQAVLSQVSFLMPVERNPAEAINGIAASVSRLPQPWRAGLQCFTAMLESADAVLAHNAAFDRQWFGREPLPAISQPWICSMEDIRWPAERQLRANPSVRDLALAYGVPVWAAHRALTDCIYLAQVLERCEALPALLEAALEPRQLFRAQLSYAERHRAKEAGFRWNDPVPGAWSRRLSEREVRALSFAVQPVEAA